MHTNTNPLIVGVLALLVFGVGFIVGRGADPTNAVFPGLDDDKTVNVDWDDSNDDDASVPNEATVRNAHLTTNQRLLLDALGVDVNQVDVTPQMMACAESKLGEPRINEIIDGATPTAAEGVGLLACYNQD
jgi:hypothetical protein